MLAGDDDGSCDTGCAGHVALCCSSDVALPWTDSSGATPPHVRIGSEEGLLVGITWAGRAVVSTRVERVEEEGAEEGSDSGGGEEEDDAAAVVRARHARRRRRSTRAGASMFGDEEVPLFPNAFAAPVTGGLGASSLATTHDEGTTSTQLAVVSAAQVAPQAMARYSAESVLGPAAMCVAAAIDAPRWDEVCGRAAHHSHSHQRGAKRRRRRRHQQARNSTCDEVLETLLTLLQPRPKCVEPHSIGVFQRQGLVHVVSYARHAVLATKLTDQPCTACCCADLHCWHADVTMVTPCDC